MSLLVMARSVATDDRDPLQQDAAAWLASKRYGGSAEQRQERTARRKERRSTNLAAKAAKMSKGSGGKAGEGKRKGGKG